MIDCVVVPAKDRHDGGADFDFLNTLGRRRRCRHGALVPSRVAGVLHGDPTAAAGARSVAACGGRGVVGAVRLRAAACLAVVAQLKCQYFVYFLLGCHAGTVIQSVVARSAWWWTLTATIIWVGAVASVATFDDPVSADTMATVVPVVAVPAALLLIFHGCRWRRAEPAAVLGRRTIHVYVMHFPVVAVLVALLGTHAWWVPPVVVVVAVAVTLAAGQVLRHVPGVFELPRRHPTGQPPDVSG